MNSKVLAAALLLLSPALAAGQELTYSLPSTSVAVEVDAVKESFFAGPYTQYARKLLGLEALESDSVISYVSEIRLVPSLEADPAARYTVSSKEAEERCLTLSAQGLVAFQSQEEAENARWRFPAPVSSDFSRKGLVSPIGTETRTTYRMVQTDTAEVRIPVHQEVEVEKSLEQRAREAAKMVLDARRERYNISTGNTDATFSGEALGAALAELNRVEQEYLALFVGYTVRERQHGSYEVVPSVSAKKQQYVAFRLSDEEGLLPAGRTSGVSYYLEFEPEPQPEATPVGKGKSVRYRVPAICQVRLTDGQSVLLQTRIPVYQLGVECEYSVR